MPHTACHNKPTQYEPSNQRAPSKCAGLSDSKFRGRRHFKDVAETEIIDPSSWRAITLTQWWPFDRLRVYDYWVWADTTSIVCLFAVHNILRWLLLALCHGKFLAEAVHVSVLFLPPLWIVFKNLWQATALNYAESNIKLTRSWNVNCHPLTRNCFVLYKKSSVFGRTKMRHSTRRWKLTETKRRMASDKGTTQNTKYDTEYKGTTQNTKEDKGKRK